MIEGRTASYIGPPDDGLAAGDRFLILSDEGSMLHVRWLTGAWRDQYTLVMARDSAPDIRSDDGVDDDPDSDLFGPIGPALLDVEGIFAAVGGDGLRNALSSTDDGQSIDRYVFDMARKVSLRIQQNPVLASAWSISRESVMGMVLDRVEESLDEEMEE